MTPSVSFLRGLVVFALVALSCSADAQTSSDRDAPLLGSSLDADILRDLPISNNPLTVLETIQPETIGNLFSAGGLGLGAPQQFGGFLNSWTQTQFRVGDISITDPRTGGMPLLVPFLPLWSRLITTAGAMGVDESASALAMRLEPLRPGTTWFRSVEGWLAGGALTATTGPVPAVDRVHESQDANFLVGGPITTRLGIVASLSWREVSHELSPSPLDTTNRAVSGFAHVVYALSARDEIRALGWVQRVTTAPSTDNAIHVQSTWERRDTPLGWRVFGGYTSRDRTLQPSSVLVVDSLTSDPVSDLMDSGSGTTRRWTIGARVAAPANDLLPALGVDVEGAETRDAPTGINQIREMVNGVPARIWTVRQAVGNDVRQITSFALHGNEHLVFGRVALDAGIRLDSLSGDANGSLQGIHWTTWLPRAQARWQISTTFGLALVAGYRRTAYQLPLNMLAIGDPAAPVADISLWRGASNGPLVARVGPGTGGNNAFTQIDPGLERPTTDERVLALDFHPRPGLQVVLARVTKREEPLLGLVNTGVSSSSYTTFQVPDSSFLPGSDDGGPFVTVYNRPPNSYGRDRYLLTNQRGDPAESWGIDLSVRASTKQFTILAGGTLTWALGPAAAVGFLPTENDQDLLGSTFVDPNSATAARGQLFPDRSHVVKIAGIYRFPWGVRLGAIARYQDGQPFARLIVAPNLVQGPTAVRGYPNGGTAFTYIGTLDVRLQKTFSVGSTELSAIADVYNLPNLKNEVSEYVVSGPAFRTPTALQPPRTVVVGIRARF